MPPDLILGLDSSTTACKAILWDTAGRALASGRSPLAMQKPRPGWHEQDAESWWQAAVASIRAALEAAQAAGVDARRLAALCIATQRETFVVTDAAGQPNGPALLWMDERCAGLLGEIDGLYGQDRIHQETGKPLSANLSLGKLYWLKKNQPERLGPGARVLDVHAFLAERLTGRAATGFGCADPMGLFDLRQMAWNRPLIEAIGLKMAQFPEVAPGGAILGSVSPEAARACGIPSGLPVVAGLGDGQAAGLGVGAAQAGQVYLNLGTAVVAGAFSPVYRTERAFRTMMGGIPGSYVLETVLLGGTYTIEWFLEQFGGPSGHSLEDLEVAASRLPPGAQGLVLVPYWNSAMNPYWDAAASGIVVGWRGIHTQAHLYRAILEGIALEQRLHFDGVEAALGQPLAQVITVGGGARSDLWLQILADVLGKPVQRAGAPGEHIEASALGAGMLAAAGAGLYPDVLSAARGMAPRAGQVFQPEPSRQAFYEALYQQVYRGLFPALQPALHALAGLVGESETPGA